jgi:hypothetical protein
MTGKFVLCKTMTARGLLSETSRLCREMSPGQPLAVKDAGGFGVAYFIIHHFNIQPYLRESRNLAAYFLTHIADLRLVFYPEFSGRSVNERTTIH